MLDELHVSNIALIEDATIAFSPSLTVLTGETGAGKTALLAALKLICGARADASVVRDGAEEALAEARLVDGDEHIVRRRLSVAGVAAARLTARWPRLANSPRSRRPSRCMASTSRCSCSIRHASSPILTRGRKTTARRRIRPCSCRLPGGAPDA